MVLELFDLVVHRVDQVEVALGDVIDEVVEDHARRSSLGSSSPPWRGCVSNGLLAGGVLRTVSTSSCGQDDVDLLVEDPSSLGTDDRHDEHDADDIVVVALDRGPGLSACSAGT